MPEIIETTVYRLEELGDTAKEKARCWYRECGFEYDWYDTVYEDFERICAILGVTFKTRTTRLHGGGISQNPCIWFSGFSSQGDGACWEGYYRYAKAASVTIRAHAPTDELLHHVADELQAVQRRNFYQLRAETNHQGHYYHEYCMSVAVTRDSPAWQDMTDDAEDIIIDALRDLARWLYRQLEKEYDYLTSDNTVDEAIVANNYRFTCKGRMLSSWV